MQSSNNASFSFTPGSDLASQNALIQGLGMNAQGLSGNSQGFMQNQQSIGYPMFDQGMQNQFQSQGNLGVNQFNPMIMQQNMNQLQGFGMPQNAMNFQMQQQMMNGGGNASMMSSMDPSQMNPYGGMNTQALLAQTLHGAQLQNAYGSADAMSMAIQGMMGGQRGNSNNGGDNYNMQGGGKNQRYNNNSNNQNNDGALRLNTVYVSDLPQDVDHDMIRDNFSKVGSIKVNTKSGMPMIWIFKDRGVPKGDALVTYDSNSSASNAVSYFKENDFNGRTVDVRIATNSERPILAPPGNNNDDNDRGGNSYNNWAKNDNSNGRPRNDYKSGNRGNDNKNRGPDWICSKCNNNNFSWRESCNRCQEPKSDDAEEVQGGRGYSGQQSNNRAVQRNSGGRDAGPMRGPKKSSSRPGPY